MFGCGPNCCGFNGNPERNDEEKTDSLVESTVEMSSSCATSFESAVESQPQVFDANITTAGNAELLARTKISSIQLWFTLNFVL